MRPAEKFGFKLILAGASESYLLIDEILAAKMLDIDDRVGSLEVGKDADIALFNGDPFEYTTNVVGTIINGERVSDIRR